MKFYSDDEILKGYEHNDLANISTLVAAHPKLAKLLIDGRKKIVEVFGDVKVTLEIDYWDDKPKLIATVHDSYTVEEAMERIHRFDHEFMFPRERGVHDYIMFNIGFL
jgi:hypothetical protein